MTTKVQSPSRAALPLGPKKLSVAGPWMTPPGTIEERQLRIEAMGGWIQDYIQFMCKLESFKGVSAEAKERAVATFYDRLVILERQLGRIQEEVKLG